MTRQRLHPGLNLGTENPGAHFEAEQVVFGFWVFLMSDLVLFAVLFATYAAMSVQGIAGGPSPSDIFDFRSAAVQTGLLLTSSFTLGLGSLAVKYRSTIPVVIGWFALTGLLGAAFLAFELSDFARLVGMGATPQRSGFLSAFFTLAGTHGVHVAAGLLWIGVMIVQLLRFGLTDAVQLRLMRLALFWHLLDIIWIGIFTFVFLFGLVR